MEDKKGIGDLLPILESLVLEHQALRSLLAEDNPNWHYDVAKYRALPDPLSRARETFREVRESLQSQQPDEFVIEKLIEALSTVLS